jgi:RNA polymerase sigma-70 factor (ECF subfamily)
VVEAEDVTALVFMKALEALPSYQSGRSGFAPWIFRIARNAIVDHYRRRRKQCALDDADQESSSQDPLSNALANEQRSELHALVTHLSAEQREVVLMRFAADLSYAEIAAIVRKNETAVRMLLYRGLRKLKAVMDDE